MTQTNNVLGQSKNKGNFDSKLADRVNKRVAAKNRQKKIDEQRKKPEPKQPDETTNLDKIVINLSNYDKQLLDLQENKEYVLKHGGCVNYVIQEEIEIPRTTKLTIEAGAQLYFFKDIGITNYGTLEIKGIGIRKAVLTALEETEGWENILNHGYLLIENAHLSYGRGRKALGGILYGGAIRNHDKADIIDSEFENNYADYGGAIHTSRDSELNIKGKNTFTNNKATTCGGAIHNENKSTLNIEGNNMFKNNKAIWGGAIRNYFGTVKIKGKNEFRNNDATKSGGAISWAGIKPDIDPKRIYENNTPNNVSKNV